MARVRFVKFPFNKIFGHTFAKRFGRLLQKRVGLLMLTAVACTLFIAALHAHTQSSSEKQVLTEFQRAVLKHAKNNVIILTTIDSFYMDFALNLHQTSLKKLDITNYIFGCLNPEACETLRLVGAR